jgi:hypothetical protein
MANAIFGLPNNQQTVLYYHAAAGLHPKKLSLMQSAQEIMPHGQA